MRIRLPILALLLFMAFVAWCADGRFSSAVFLIMAEFVGGMIAIELLVSAVPEPLLARSQENCYRIDGSWSPQRAKYEQTAQQRIRTELLAVILLFALGTNALLLCGHLIMPISTSLKVVGAVDLDSDRFKENLRKSGVVREFENVSRRRGVWSHEKQELSKRILWDLAPVFPLLVGAWGIGSLLFFRFAYSKILREFDEGIQRRSHVFVNRDITRLQSADLEETQV